MDGRPRLGKVCKLFIQHGEGDFSLLADMMLIVEGRPSGLGSRLRRCCVRVHPSVLRPFVPSFALWPNKRRSQDSGDGGSGSQ